ncbi:MAG: nucleotidyltransferase domain-containing protein [Planctomycetota bacterium]
MAQVADSKIILEIIKKYLVHLRNAHISFDQVYLYGSYAKGNPQGDSDIDLAIISQEWQPDIFEAQFELMKLGRKVDTRIEPHPLRKSEFNKTNPYAREILTTGKQIKI